MRPPHMEAARMVEGFARRLFEGVGATPPGSVVSPPAA